ncbi:MAG: hypothetical protein J0L92_40450, partial [Deltaproteobacteria bacterium]|nr:hypothetical protein [Deltaproteobacteria bacterium]
TLPGLVAPRPSLRAASDVAADDVLERWRSWRDGGRWALAGRLEAPRMPLGEASAHAALPTTAPSTGRVTASVEHLERLIVVALPACESLGLATAMREAWAGHARASGIEITWATQGSARGMGWVAMTGRGTPEASAAWEQRVRGTSMEDLRARAEALDREANVRWADPIEVATRAALGAGTSSACAEPPRLSAVWLDPPIASRRR